MYSLCTRCLTANSLRRAAAEVVRRVSGAHLATPRNPAPACAIPLDSVAALPSRRNLPHSLENPKALAGEEDPLEMKQPELFLTKTTGVKEAVADSFAPDFYASSVAKMNLQAPLSVVSPGECDEGDVVLVRVRDVNTAYPTIETTEVKEVVLERGNLLVG